MRESALTTLRAPAALIAASLLFPAALGFGSGCGAEGDEGKGASRVPPNVVVVMTDDQDTSSLRVMPRVRRELAAKGTSFENAFATLPECCPSRATLLTGQYAHNHGVRANLPPKGGYAALDGSSTLPVWLRAAGYRTGYVGKYLNGYGDRRLGEDPGEVPPGWRRWHALTLHTEFQTYGYTLNENGRLRRYGNRARDYQTDVLARKAVSFIRRSAARDSPFFLVVATLAPHDEGPLVLGPASEVGRNPRPAPRHRGAFAGRALPEPPSFNERDVSDKPAVVATRDPLGHRRVRQIEAEHRSRLESLLAVDELVGDVVGELRRADELGRTLIVFTSDNGFLEGEHRVTGKALPYEESVRVPLIVRGPGIPAGASRRQLAGNIDLAPTIADAAGAEPGLEMDGVSLIPVARDPSARGRRALLLELLAEHPYAGIRTRRHVYVRHAGGETELYDLARDPHQLRSRHDDPSYDRVQRRLAARLAALRDCAGEGCRRP